MKRERKYLKATKMLFLLIMCLSFTSCITINRAQEHQHLDTSIDPVCGMRVDTATARKTDYNGRIYYFDTEECQKVFLKNPEKFAFRQKSHRTGHNMQHMGMGWAGGAIMVTAMAIAMMAMIFAHW